MISIKSIRELELDLDIPPLDAIHLLAADDRQEYFDYLNTGNSGCIAWAGCDETNIYTFGG